MISDELAVWMNKIEREIEKLKVFEVPKASSGWVYLGRAGGLPILVSTSWDGDSFSTTAKTLIDLSVVFGAPAAIKAVDVQITIRDSGSAGADCYLILSPNNTAGEGKSWRCDKVNDVWFNASGIIPCDINGDIYYQIAASGAGTFDVIIQIWGYEKP